MPFSTIIYLNVLINIVSVIFQLSIAVYIYLKDRTSGSNQSFLFFVISCSLWFLVGTAMILSRVPEHQTLMMRFRMATGAMLQISFLQFSIIAPSRNKLYPYIKYPFYIWTAVMAVVSAFTNLVVVSTTFVDPTISSLSFVIVPGPLMIVYDLQAVAIATAMLSIFIYKWIVFKGIAKTTTILIFIGFMFSGLSALFFSVLVPMFFNNTRFWIDVIPAMNFLPTSLIAYAIFRFKTFLITPRQTAQEILSAIQSSVFISNTSGHLLYQEADMDKMFSLEDQKKIINEAITSGNIQRYSLIGTHDHYVLNARLCSHGAVVFSINEITTMESTLEKEKMLNAMTAAKMKAQKELRFTLERIINARDTGQMEASIAEGLETFRADKKAFRSIELVAAAVREGFKNP